MMFLLRSAFWIATVAFFLPGDPAADALTGSARTAVQTVTTAADDGAFAAVADVCMDSPDLCTAGVNAIDDAQDLAVQGLDALAATLNDEKTASN